MACQCLKPIRQLYAETAAILLDSVLNMEMRGGIVIVTIQNIVNAGRDLEVLEEILAEECEIEDGVTTGIAALDGDRLAKGISGVVKRAPVAGVKKFPPGEDLIFIERHA